MSEDDLPPEKAKARDDLEDFLQAHASELGPWDEDGEMDVPPTEERFVSGWVLVSYWVDANGDGFTVRMPSKGLPTHARMGLLHEGLYGFSD